MIGRRLPDVLDKSYPAMQPGDYVKVDGVGWYCVTPNGHAGNLRNHQVVEHEDGTITVSPSILVTGELTVGGSKELWHGFLERGIWRSC